MLTTLNHDIWNQECQKKIHNTIHPINQGMGSTSNVIYKLQSRTPQASYKKSTYREKLLQIFARCNIAQESKTPVDFNPQSRGKLQNWILWNVDFWNVCWCPVVQYTQLRITNYIKIRESHNNLNILLVDEGGRIGPQEQYCQCEYGAMTDQSQQVVFKQLEQNPYCSCTTKHSCRNLFVPPQNNISSYNKRANRTKLELFPQIPIKHYTWTHGVEQAPIWLLRKFWILDFSVRIDEGLSSYFGSQNDT